MQRVQKGDTIKVIAGKDRGQTGEVVEVLVNENRVLVNGVNIVTRHQKARPGPSGQTIPAQIVHKEAPLHISNVMPVCPSCGKATRISFRVRESDNHKVRVCKKCGADLD